MINNLPTIFEVVNGAAAKKQSKEKTPNSSSKSSKSNTKPVVEAQTKSSGMMRPKEESENENGDEESGEEDGEEYGTTPCGACWVSDGEFWICCGVCERWFHVKCVKITPARAELKQYKCPSCSNKRARG